MTRVATNGLLCAIALTFAGASAERHWQTGTWTDVATRRQMVDFGPGSSGFGPPNAAPSLRALADVRTFVIETDELRLELQDLVPLGRRSIDVVIGTSVTFAIEKNSVYVRDRDGAEHRLRLTKKTARRAAPAAAVYSALGGGHLIRAVSTEGRYVTLEDGSRWEIHPRDRFHTVDWQPQTTVTVRTTRVEDGFAYELVNTEQDEGALAKYVKP
jgi:hypothetical protein